MKTILKALVISFVMCMCMLVTAAGASPATVPYGEAVIDGQQDECYSSFAPIATAVLSSSNNGKTGAAAQIWLTWDYNGLNIYAEVDDATPDITAQHKYERDSIEIFIDEDCSKSGITDNNDAHYRIVRDNFCEVGLSAENNFISKVVDKGETYIIETTVPWRDLLPMDGLIVGFDFMVNDAVSGKRETMMLWNSTTNANYRTTEDYGEIMLINGDNYKPWDGERPLMITMNSYKVDCGDVTPIVVDGRTLVPMRAIFERFNAGVVWNDKERTVYAIGNDKFIKLPIDSKTVFIDEVEQELDVPAMIINGRTMVPVRFIAETFGALVEYDEYIGAVTITY